MLYIEGWRWSEFTTYINPQMGFSMYVDSFVRTFEKPETALPNMLGRNRASPGGVCVA